MTARSLGFCPLLLKLRHTTWKHPQAWLAVFLSDVPRTHTHFFLTPPGFAVRAYRRLYGSPSPCAPCLAGALSSGDRAAPTMTRVEDGREMNALPENRHIWGGPVNAARSTGKESFFFFFSFSFKGPSSSSRVASVWRGGGAKKKKSCFACSLQGAWSLGYIFPPCPAATLQMLLVSVWGKKCACVWGGGGISPFLSHYFQHYPFFWFVFHARCFERQGRLRAAGVVWGWWWWCSVERRGAACSTAQTSGGPSLRLNHNNTADSPRRAGREGSGAGGKKKPQTPGHI